MGTVATEQTKSRKIYPPISGNNDAFDDATASVDPRTASKGISCQWQPQTAMSSRLHFPGFLDYVEAPLVIDLCSVIGDSCFF